VGDGHHPDVLFVITDLAVGGAEHQVIDLSIRLARRGWRVHLVSLQPPAMPLGSLSDAGVSVEHLGMRTRGRDPRVILRLASAIRRSRPDVVHSHMVHANLAARSARLLSGMRPLVSSSHSTSEGGHWRRLALRTTKGLDSLSTCVSKGALRAFVRDGVISRRRAEWVPNGVDLARFHRSDDARSSVRTELGIDADGFLWLAVGRLTALKRHDRLLHAFADLGDASAMLALAGDGELRGELTAQAQASTARGRVRLLGRRGDPEALMSAADGLALCSEEEALPIVLIEAAACELPSVATDVGGCREVVVDNMTGTLVDPDDMSSLVDAMRAMMSRSGRERAAMGKAARGLATERFDIDRIVARWEAIYTSLGAHPTGARLSSAS
jgi:glycosyltransferase involved in cell wall biosynthesis